MQEEKIPREEGMDTPFGELALRLSLRFQNFCRNLEAEDPNEGLFQILNETLHMVRDELTIARGREVDKILVIYQEDFIVANSSLEENNESFRFSKTIVKNVVNQNESFFSRDIKTDAQYRNVESVRILDVHSLLCVPLRFMGECIGAIYADSHSIDGISRKDLQFMEDFSRILSPYIYSIRGFIEEKSQEKKDEFEIIGKSREIQDVFKAVEKVAPTDSTILLEGETGTGKELFARLIHSKSPRRTKPFVPVNCAAIPSNLLESELFGHEKGAFTGAFGRKLGKFELASGGTLFLDEVSELDMVLQTKLLRALEEREIERVGGLETIPVDLRIITATNRKLVEEVERGRIRRDLFFRLNVISIQLPPLRERKEDIQLLVEHYVKKFGKRVGKTIHVSPEVLSFLKKYPWAGNVRELKNVMERMVLFCEGKTLQLSDLPPEIRNYTIEEKEVPLFESFHDPQYVWGKGLLRLEKEVGSKLKVVLEQFIERCEGDEGIQSMEDFILRACYVFGDSKSTFYDYLKKYQLEEKRIELSRSLRQK